MRLYFVIANFLFLNWECRSDLILTRVPLSRPIIVDKNETIYVMEDTLRIKFLAIGGGGGGGGGGWGAGGGSGFLEMGEVDLKEGAVKVTIGPGGTQCTHGGDTRIGEHVTARGGRRGADVDGGNGWSGGGGAACCSKGSVAGGGGYNGRNGGEGKGGTYFNGGGGQGQGTPLPNIISLSAGKGGINLGGWGGGGGGLKMEGKLVGPNGRKFGGEGYGAGGSYGDKQQWIERLYQEEEDRAGLPGVVIFYT